MMPLNKLNKTLYIITFFAVFVWLVVYKIVVSVVPMFAPNIMANPWYILIEWLMYKIFADKIVVEDEFINDVKNMPSKKVNIIDFGINKFTHFDMLLKEVDIIVNEYKMIDI